MDNFFDAAGKVATNRAGDLCIVASAEWVASLKIAPAIGNLGEPAILALDPAEPLPDEILRNKRVLVIEVDPVDPASLRRVRNIRESHGDLKIIAAIAQASVVLVRTLVRQGICDVAELPFKPDELAAQVLDASSADLQPIDALPLCPLVLVVSSVGGSGSTTVLTHLAAELGRSGKGSTTVCLADLDLQAGEVAAYIGETSPVTIGALIEAGDRLDDELVASAILETRHGFSMLAAPVPIMPLDIVDTDRIDLIVSALRRRFAFVLADLPANWTNWSLSLAASADRILVVTDSSIASLRQARRKIDLLETVGVDRNAIGVIANRVERRLFRTVGTEDIAHALRVDVIASLGDEGSALRAAQDQGVLLAENLGRNAFTKTIAALAATLRGEEH